MDILTPEVIQHMLAVEDGLIKTGHQSEEQALEEGVGCSSVWGSFSDHRFGPSREDTQ